MAAALVLRLHPPLLRVDAPPVSAGNIDVSAGLPPTNAERGGDTHNGNKEKPGSGDCCLIRMSPLSPHVHPSWGEVGPGDFQGRFCSSRSINILTSTYTL